MQVRQITPIKYYIKEKMSRQWGAFSGLGEIRLGIRKRAKLQLVDMGLNLLGRFHLNYLRALEAVNYVSGRPQEFSYLPLEGLRLRLGKKRGAMEIKSIDGQTLNHSPDLVCYFDVDHNFRWMNVAMLESLGYESTDLVGRQFISFLHPDDVGLAKERFASLVNTRRSNPCELRLRKREGGYIWGWLVGRTLVERDKSVGVVVHIRDITQRKRDEMRKILYQRLNTLCEVWGGINHEVNNALFPVLALIEMFEKRLSMGKADPEIAVQYLQKMVGNADRLRSLPRRLHLFAEFSGQEKIYSDLVLLIDAVLKHFEKKFMESGISVIRRERLALEAKGPLMMRLHFGGVQMLLMDLLNNAVDAINIKRAYTKDFPREISVSLSVEEGEKNVAILKVCDTGCGIKAEDKEKIFEPFFTTKPAGKGTGLGMMLMQHVVQEHGGSIEVNSESDQGTEVIVRLPAN